MLNEIVSRTEELRDILIKFRREIHSSPELSGKEEKTAAFVAGVLESRGLDIRKGIGGHGVSALIRGASDGPTVALRADMDALPIQDKKDVAYASRTPDVMHACGHDVHTTVLLGVAIVLSGMTDRLKGNVKLIFQPAEESTTGAEAMIKDDLFDDGLPGAILALHCLPELESGKIGHKSGIMAASADRVSIVIKGKSGHASRPHQTVDAVLVSSMVINAIHHIVSRRTDPFHPAVISIGTIKGGNAENIIADRVEMEGTVRTLDGIMRKKLSDMIEEVVRGITSSMGAEYDFHYSFDCPAVYNDPIVDDLVKECACDVLGKEGVVELEEPMMGSEDFAFFLESIPGVLFRLGTGNRHNGADSHLHNSLFDVDEESILIGTKLMSWAAVKYINDIK